eukprot:11688086-Alexandrium_andersonii.AAC.1
MFCRRKLEEAARGSQCGLQFLPRTPQAISRVRTAQFSVSNGAVLVSNCASPGCARRSARSCRD